MPAITYISARTMFFTGKQCEVRPQLRERCLNSEQEHTYSSYQCNHHHHVPVFYTLWIISQNFGELKLRMSFTNYITMSFRVSDSSNEVTFTSVCFGGMKLLCKFEAGSIIMVYAS